MLFSGVWAVSNIWRGVLLCYRSARTLRLLQMTEEQKSEQPQEPPKSGEKTSGGWQTGFRERIEDMERTLRVKMKEVDSVVRNSMQNVFPPDVTKHLNNSKREFLLAVKRIVDREIERTERQAASPDAGKPDGDTSSPQKEAAPPASDPSASPFPSDDTPGTNV